MTKLFAAKITFGKSRAPRIGALMKLKKRSHWESAMETRRPLPSGLESLL